MVGERGIHKILERYGRPVFEAHKEFLFDSTEQMMRSELRSIPDGTYVGRSYAYYDGKIPGSKYKIKVTITVEDGTAKFDYTGTDGQTPGFMNGTYTSSASATLLTLLQMLNPDIRTMPDSASHRDHYPERNPAQRRLPRRHHLRQPPVPPTTPTPSCALSPVIPERVTAESGASCCALSPPALIRARTRGSALSTSVSWAPRRFRRHLRHRRLRSHRHDRCLRRRARPRLRRSSSRLHPTWCSSTSTSHGLCRPRPLAGGVGVETLFEFRGKGIKVVTFGDGDVEPSWIRRAVWRVDSTSSN